VDPDPEKAFEVNASWDLVPGSNCVRIRFEKWILLGNHNSLSFKTLGDFSSFLTGAGGSRCDSQRGEFQVLVRLLFSIVVGGKSRRWQ
jgi:hypothetical protein